MGLRGNRTRGLHAKGWLAVTFVHKGRVRTFAPKAWLCIALTVVLPVLATWYLGATIYVVFHDPLLASLITRQTDMQYAYEDRIAGLRTELDRATSRGMLDRHRLDTTVRDLSQRSVVLEQHAAAVDRLVARSRKGMAQAMTDLDPQPSAERTAQPADSTNPLLAPDRTGSLPADAGAYVGDEPPHALAAPREPLRLDGLSDARVPPDTAPDPELNPAPMSRHDKRADVAEPVMTVAADADRIAASLSRVDAIEAHTLLELREPAVQTIARVKAALLSIGLPVPAAARQADVGGPFVPLPAGTLDFDTNAALVEDAMAQADQLNTVAATVPLRKPLAGPLEVTSTFGPRLDPFFGRPAMHTGIDFRETYGGGVRATAAGIVTIAGSQGGYGTMIEVDHGNGLVTRYAHLSSVNVVPDQRVAAGDVIGHVGSSGRATGPHLHYETRINGQPVDPTRFLKVGARLFDQ